jgi:hypothetical protein
MEYSCKVKYEEGLPNTVYEEMRKYFSIYEEGVRHIWSDMKNILDHYFLLKIGWIKPKNISRYCPFKHVPP